MVGHWSPQMLERNEVGPVVQAASRVMMSGKCARGGHADDDDAAFPFQGARPLPGPGGSDLRAPARRLGRGDDQDRAAAGGRMGRVRRGDPARLRLLQPQPQQTQPDPQPQARGGQGDLPAPGRDGGRGGRELPARGQAPPGDRLRGAAGGQSANRLRQPVRLRSKRALCRARRAGSDRPGPGRPHVGHRRTGARADAGRHPDLRSHLGPTAGPGRADGAARA